MGTFVMNQFENVNADTRLTDREIRQLVARLARAEGNDSRTSIRDIAEALDLDVETVAANVRMIREEKSEPPQDVQRLASVLDDMKTPISRRISMAMTKRIMIVSTLCVASVFGVILYAAYYTSVHSPVTSVVSEAPDSVPPTMSIKKVKGSSPSQEALNKP